MQKNKLLLVATSILLLPAIALGFQTATSITQIVKSLATLLSNLAIFITIACWIWTGLMFLMARGDPSGVTKAKTALMWAIVGTAVSLLSGTATAIINNAITFGG